MNGAAQRRQTPLEYDGLLDLAQVGSFALDADIAAVVKAVVAWIEDQAAFRSGGMVWSVGFSGLRWTVSMRIQFRVAPDHRLGCRSLAAA